MKKFDAYEIYTTNDGLNNIHIMYCPDRELGLRLANGVGLGGPRGRVNPTKIVSFEYEGEIYNFKLEDRVRVIENEEQYNQLLIDKKRKEILRKLDKEEIRFLKENGVV